MSITRRTRTRTAPTPRLVPRRGQTVQEPEASGIGRVIQLPTTEDAEVLTSVLRKARWEARRPREDGFIHVSDLLSKCLRRIALVAKNEVRDPGQPLNLMDSLTFRVGDAIHDVIKERAASGAPAEVWGNWKCKCGRLATSEPCLASRRPNEQCEHCEGYATEYKEVSIYDRENNVVGHPDLILWRPRQRAFYVTELKSISADQWKDLVRAKPDHILQVLFYWHMMLLEGHDVIDQCSILYVTKGYTFKGAPYKEFTFKPSEQVHRLGEYLASAKSLNNAITDEGPLPVAPCVSPQAPEAKKCPVCDLCFGGEIAKPVKFSIAQAMRPATATKANSR